MVLNLATTGPEDTQALGAALADLLEVGDVVLLAGELGAGKTCLVQGVAVGLGVEERVTSPTFTLVRSYAGRIELFHADIYRLEHLDEVADLGLAELIDDRGVAFVEWGDAATAVLPPDHLEVSLTAVDDDHRRIEVRPAGLAWSERMGKLTTTLAQWVEQ